MRITKQQKGFSPIEILLLLLLILFLILIGWYVFNSKNNTPDPKNASPPPPSASSSQKSQSVPKAETIDYLKIPELGIKIQLSDGIKNAYYYINPNVKDVAYLSLTDLKTTECAADKISISAVGKNIKTDHFNDQPGNPTYEDNANGGAGVVIGNYAYTVERAQAYCIEDQNSADFKKADAAQKEFKASSINITLL